MTRGAGRTDGGRVASSPSAPADGSAMTSLPAGLHRPLPALVRERPELLSAATGLLRTVPGSVAVLDAAGRIALTNEAWDDFADAGGGTIGCGVGSDYLEVCQRAAEAGESAASRAADAITEVIAGGGASAPFTYPCVTPAGTRWFMMTAAWWPELPGVVVSHVDVTDVTVAQQASEASLRAVSHDLRGPLTIVIGMGRLLQSRGDAMTGQQRDQLLERLLSAAHRLENDLGNLTALDRLQAGTWAPRPADTAVDVLVHELVDELDLPARRVSVDVPTGLRCGVDAPWLERIVVNLVANGVRHTPSSATVWVRARLVAADRLVLVVEDDGPGIPEEERDRILEAFERAGSKTEGSGLGLSIVSRFTSLLGGDLTVGERPGGGARFTVGVPVTAVEDEGAATVR